MKHNIRQRVINQYGLPVVKVETVIGELGSDLLDCNGKEIFDGDIISATSWDGNITFYLKVFFRCGTFWVCDPENDYSTGDFDIDWLDSLAQFHHIHDGDVEIIGHAED